MQALLEGLKREQKKMVKEMQASQQATIKAVREESRQEIRRLEASADAQVPPPYMNCYMSVRYPKSAVGLKFWPMFDVFEIALGVSDGSYGLQAI